MLSKSSVCIGLSKAEKDETNIIMQQITGRTTEVL